MEYENLRRGEKIFVTECELELSTVVDAGYLLIPRSSRLRRASIVVCVEEHREFSKIKFLLF